MFLLIFVCFFCLSEFKKVFIDLCVIIYFFDLFVVFDVNIINVRFLGSILGSVSGVFVLYVEN